MTILDRARPQGVPTMHCVADDRATDDMSLAGLVYLHRGLSQPGGKLPLFDLDGQQVNPRIVRDCLARGLAEPWFPNPLKPDWLVCRLTDSGRRLAESIGRT